MPSSNPLRWADLRGARVGVWGIGTEGTATLGTLEARGIAAHVLVDDHPRRPDVVSTDAGGLDRLLACDVVIKAPGISRYSDAVHALEAAGVTVAGGLGLWLEEVGPDRVIGITGTKGKSTTTAVAGHLARRLGVRSATGGNLGTVPWAPGARDDLDLWVIEVSSYQATDLWSSPAVAAVTSLHADHLNWHGDVETYVRDKLSLCGRPGARSTVANGDDAWLRDRAELLQPGPRWVSDAGVETGWTTPLGLRGRHNVRNALIAAACLEEFGVDGAADPARLAWAAEGYEPLPHRLQTVGIVDGVEYVDDSLSTNVLPTIAAAQAFEGRPLALLVGGFERDIDYAPLAEFAAQRYPPMLVLTLPQNGDRIHAAMAGVDVDAVRCADIPSAVREASQRVEEGGVVLLSPAAASYGIYADHKERAQVFADAVRRLGSGR